MRKQLVLIIPILAAIVGIFSIVGLNSVNAQNMSTSENNMSSMSNATMGGNMTGSENMTSSSGSMMKQYTVTSVFLFFVMYYQLQNKVKETLKLSFQDIVYTIV